MPGKNGIHELIIQKEQFEIQSADVGFYAFMGNRFYYPLDKLVLEEDHPLLKKQIADCSGKPFILRLLSETGEGIHFIARITQGENRGMACVRLIRIETHLEMELELHHELDTKKGILSLYNDDFFEYHANTGEIRIFTIREVERERLTWSLKEFEEALCKNAGDSEQERVKTFIQVMRSGRRNFEISVRGNLFTEDAEEETVTTIRGISLYRDNRYVSAAGYIHVGNTRGSGREKRTELDYLTGVLSKAEITRRALELIESRRQKHTALAIVDVDYFKKVNDTFGHMVGDEVLRDVARLIDKVVGDAGIVGRIGGDEFMVIFYDVIDMENSRELLRSMRDIIRAHYPSGQPGKPVISLSIGCAVYPKDADRYETLFLLADHALYQAKKKGRNRYVIYDEKLHGSLEDIRGIDTNVERINNRGDMSMGDILCLIMDRVYTRKNYSCANLFEDAIVNLDIQRITLYAGRPYRIIEVYGERRPPEHILRETEGYMNDGRYQELFDETGTLVVDDTPKLFGKHDRAYEMLSKQNVKSFMQFQTEDRHGLPVVISFEAVRRKVAWNNDHVHYYRLFSRLLREYRLG